MPEKMVQNEISVEERKDMLVLAQQKLDEMNQGRGSFFTGNTKSSSKKCAAASLLSTLLYMALMAFKVEDMKAMLKQIDFESYEVRIFSEIPVILTHSITHLISQTSTLTTAMGCPFSRATLSRISRQREVPTE